MVCLPSERMWLAFQPGQGMVVAHQSDGFGISYLIDDLDATSCLSDAKAPTSENFFVTLGVEFGETLAELEFLTIDF